MNKTLVETSSTPWKSIYLIGGATALVPVILGLLDIALTFLPAGAGPEPGQGSVLEWFTLLQNNSFLGLRSLGLWNIISSALSVLLYLALFAVLRGTRPASAALAVIIFCLGTGVYIANNPALPMLELSQQYASITDDAQKAQLLAAGQAVLAQGEDFTPGSFLGFLLTEIAGLMMAFVIFQDGCFGRLTPVAGMLSAALLLVFTIWATFIPVYYSVALLVAALGGLLSIAWYILLARRLFRLGRGIQS